MRTDATYLNQVQMAEAIFGDPKKESVIRLWRDTYGIPTEIIEDKRLLDAGLEPVFRQIQALKAEKPPRKKAEIQAAVNQALIELGLPLGIPDLPEAPAQPTTTAEQLAEAFAPLFQQQTQATLGMIDETLRGVVRGESELGIRLADSEAERGRLEVLTTLQQAELDQLKQQLLAQAQEVKLLPEKTQAVEKLEQKAAELEDQLSQAARMRAEAEAEAQALAESQQLAADRMRQAMEELREAKLRAEALAEEREKSLEHERQALAKKEVELQAEREALAAERSKGLFKRLFGPKK